MLAQTLTAIRKGERVTFVRTDTGFDIEASGVNDIQARFTVATAIAEHASDEVIAVAVTDTVERLRDQTGQE